MSTVIRCAQLQGTISQPLLTLKISVSSHLTTHCKSILATSQMFPPIVYISKKHIANSSILSAFAIEATTNNESNNNNSGISVLITTKRANAAPNNAWVVRVLTLFAHKQKHWQSAASKAAGRAALSMWLTCAHQWLLRRQFARKFKFVYSWFCGASCEKTATSSTAAANEVATKH